MRCNRYNGNVKPGNGNEVKTTWLLVTGRGRGVVWWWRVEDYEGCCFVTEWRQNFCHIPVIIGVLAAYSHCMKVVTGAVTSKLTPFIVPPHSIGDWLNKYWRTFAEHEISTPSWRVEGSDLWDDIAINASDWRVRYRSDLTQHPETVEWKVLSPTDICRLMLHCYSRKLCRTHTPRKSILIFFSWLS